MELTMRKYDYSFELKSELSELKTLCRHLEDCGNLLGLQQKCIYEINIGLDELFTNIVSYGYEDDLEHKIKFSLEVQSNALTVQVEDDGIPFNPLRVEKHETASDIDSINIGGLGIHLIKKMMDNVDYQRSEGKNKVILRKYISAN
jgi:anti-sigma regulatory factor (Ser/Thr protein kinase)